MGGSAGVLPHRPEYASLNLAGQGRGRPWLSVRSDWVLNLTCQMVASPLGPQETTAPSCHIPSSPWWLPRGVALVLVHVMYAQPCRVRLAEDQEAGGPP
jgi:hypothetical protein